MNATVNVVRGERRGKVIIPYLSDGTVNNTPHKSINAAKKANRVTKYPVRKRS